MFIKRLFNVNKFIFVDFLSSEIIHNVTPCPLRAPLVVTFVGLPCRGKSLAAHKIARHLCWRGESAKGMYQEFRNVRITNVWGMQIPEVTIYKL